MCSIGEGFGTDGAMKDLLKIMGLLTLEEAAGDSVAVFFVPENVFLRISEADKRRKERRGERNGRDIITGAKMDAEPPKEEDDA